MKQIAEVTQAVVSDAASFGAKSMILERDDSIVDFDKRVLFKEVRKWNHHEPIRYSHDRAANEPRLWVPDAIAWSYVRGGDWRRRVRPLIESVIRLSP